MFADSDAMWAAGANAHWIGTLPYLLPYVEMDNLYRRLEFNWDVNGDGPPWMNTAVNWTMAQVKVKTFLCPSDSHDGVPSVASRMGTLATSPTATGGTVSIRGYTLATTPDAANLGRTNYVGNAGRMGFVGAGVVDLHEGPFSNRSKTTLTGVTDGSSNTLLFGETLGGPPTPYTNASGTAVTRTYSFAWMGMGVNVSSWGLNPLDTTWRNFSSKHTGVVLFAFGDGAVKGLRQGADTATFRNIAGMKDGSVPDTSTYYD